MQTPTEKGKWFTSVELRQRFSGIGNSLVMAFVMYYSAQLRSIVETPLGSTSAVPALLLILVLIVCLYVVTEIVFDNMPGVNTFFETLYTLFAAVVISTLIAQIISLLDLPDEGPVALIVTSLPFIIIVALVRAVVQHWDDTEKK